MARKVLSKAEYESANNIANLIRSIMTEIESFVNQIILDNYPKEVTECLYSRVSLLKGSVLVNIMLFNVNTNTIVNYDIELFKLLQMCSGEGFEYLMNEKVPKMVKKSEEYSKAEEARKVYLEHSI